MGQRRRGLRNLWNILLQGYIKIDGKDGGKYTLSFIPAVDTIQCIRITPHGNEIIAREAATFANFMQILDCVRG